jgi:hypothetical protein
MYTDPHTHLLITERRRMNATLAASHDLETRRTRTTPNLLHRITARVRRRRVLTPADRRPSVPMTLHGA